MTTDQNDKLAITPLDRTDIPKSGNRDTRKSSKPRRPPTLPCGQQKDREHGPLRKVKTGCITCKIRKIKCDETKPACNKCTSTGRRCDGYTLKPARLVAKLAKETGEDERTRSVLTTRPILPLTNFPISVDESHVFEFLRTRTVPTLSANFNRDFWASLVLEISQTEPIIKHGLLAVGSMHEQTDAFGSVFGWNSRTKRPYPHLSFALQHYTKAIELLRTELLSTEPSIPIVLTACILFICVEFLRGHFEAGIAQIQNGMDIITTSFNNLSITGRLGSSFLSSDLVRNNLMQHFYGLGILGSLFGKPPKAYPVGFTSWNGAEELGRGFTSISEARTAMLSVMSQVSPFVQRHSQLFREKDYRPDPEMLETKALYEERLEQWSRALVRYIDQARQGRYPVPTRSSVAILRMQHIIGLIWLRTCLKFSELCFDCHIPDFERVVNLGEICADSFRDESVVVGSETDKKNSPFLFALDLGVIPPLFWTATKCRHPRIRRRALKLLYHKAPRQEGLWFAMEAASFGSRIVEIEESGPSFHYQGPNPLEEVVIPTEGARVWSGYVEDALKDRTPMFIPTEDLKDIRNIGHPSIISTLDRMVNTGSKYRWVTFKWKPDGAWGEANYRHELIRDLEEQPAWWDKPAKNSGSETKQLSQWHGGRGFATSDPGAAENWLNALF